MEYIYKAYIVLGNKKIPLNNVIQHTDIKDIMIFENKPEINNSTTNDIAYGKFRLIWCEHK